MEGKKDVKLFFSLMAWMLIPSIYLAIRMHIVTVNEVDINILGQMEWFDLIDEVIITALITPLYLLLKPKNPSQNGFAFITSFGIYTCITTILSLFIGNIASFMQAKYAKQYLTLQAFSLLIGFIGTFCIMLFTINELHKLVTILTIIKLILLGVSDYIFIGNYGDLGAAYSDIAINLIISFISLTYAISSHYIKFKKAEKKFIQSWIKIGIFSGLQIFLDNFIYAVMVCKMVNMVQESGNYWIANNFIWGWLLIPVSCLVQIIQKNSLEKITKNNVIKPCVIFFAVWIFTEPLWEVFIKNIMGIKTVAEVTEIVKIMFPFYLCYTVSACIDAWFISIGKTVYMFINSVMVNVVYYGIVYIVFKNNLINPNMRFIEVMFGAGMIVHLIVSIILYIYHQKIY